MPLTYASPWYDARSSFGPDDVDVVPSYAPNRVDSTILLDCGYGYPPGKKSRTDAYYSPFRITVAVPGHALRCIWDHYPVIGCDTAPEADGTIGAAKQYKAERINLSTTLLGFGLRSSRDDVQAVAATSRFVCSETTPKNDKVILSCTRDQDRIDVHLQGGRSVEVVQFGPDDKPERARYYDQIVFRFGLQRELSTSNGVHEVWQEQGSLARITMKDYFDSRMTVILSDTTFPETSR